MRSSFTRSLLWLSAVFIAVFIGEFVFEWIRLGKPDVASMSWADANNAKLVDVLSPMARAYNNILAMLIATIGLAIPLTANMHTPKLIEMFFRDRLNQLVLMFMAFGAANVLWVDYIVGPKFAPVWAFRIAIFGSLAGWAILVPYFFYVVRFLDPSNILKRLEEETTGVVEAVERGEQDPNTAQTIVHERLYQIGTIILKSLDRADRGVALEGIWSLKKIIDHHGERKERMPARWFEVDRGDFVGLSAEAIDILNEEKTWFEMKALTQMFLAYQHALAKTSDVISSISDANRVIATNANKRGDAKTVNLAIKHFNNFLRESIKKKDNHSIYDVFYEYRLLAKELRDRPDVLLEVAKYFRYYGDLARHSGLEFVYQLAAFDLGYIVRRAYEVESPNARAVLDKALGIPHAGKDKPLALVVKAKLIVGGFFLEKKLEAEAALVRENLRDVPADAIAAAEHDLLAAERSFFEVTDRQVNLEYLEPSRRDHVKKFVASFAG